MLKYKGGENVGTGTYWNFENGTRIDVAKSGMLPGGEGVTYHKIAPATMLIAAPFVGLVYVIILPFLIVGTVVVAAGKVLLDRVVEPLAAAVSFGWRPGEAHLAGKEKGKTKPNNNEPS